MSHQPTPEYEALRQRLVAEATAKAEAEAQRIYAEKIKLAELAKLPEQHGFATMADFVQALRPLLPPNFSIKPERRRPYVRLTDEQKKLARERVAAGEAPTKIARELGVSPSTIYHLSQTPNA